VLVGVDIGGTFTDGVAVAAGQLRTIKLPSTPADPAAAVLAALDALGQRAAPTRVLHGTTLVTNMLLERRGARTGFVTTQGMRDLLHIGRHERPLNYAIRQELPQQHHPPVPRRRRICVPERLSADGSVVIPLDEEALRHALRQLLRDGVQALAIGFLHAYRQPRHELRAAALAAQEAPEVFTCCSHEVSPRFREYERFLTSAWNAHVAPGATTYLRRLVAGLEERWPQTSLAMMTSSGGLETLQPAAAQRPGSLARTPIRLALSGPAAAASGVARVARELGLQDCVGLDVGGTSADIVVLRGGRLRRAPMEERRVGGYPLQIPMLDLETMGAGGGSLVRRDRFGALRIGPRSAGARPGPACYGQGGSLATVTDAAVVAGRLPSQVLLAGTLRLQHDLARQALVQACGPAGEPVCQALEILALTEADIAFAIRERTVARGLDPSAMALVAAGGAGPLLAAGVAEVLELAEVVVPPHPGLLAAWGLLAAPERREATATVLRPLEDVADLPQRYVSAVARLPRARPAGVPLQRSAALRYAGQGNEVQVPVADPTDLDALARAFHRAHEREYGFDLPAAALELVSLRVAWEQPAPTWRFPDAPLQQAPIVRCALWELDEYERPERRQARALPRSALRPGEWFAGPAVLLEPDSTSYVPTGWRAQRAPGGHLRIRRA